MFTGIIQTVSKITQICQGDVGCSIFFDCIEISNREICIGDSIAVNGCCLTVVEKIENVLKIDVSAETLSRTLISEYQVNTSLNIELAMLPQTRFGGHIVSGHVDCIGRVIAIEDKGLSKHLTFEVPGAGRFIAEKGSVTIDGVSLTVNHVEDANNLTRFLVNIIPHTLKTTTFSQYAINTRVHIEVDMVARYVERLIQYRMNNG